MKEWLLMHLVDIAILLTLGWYAVDGWGRGFLDLIEETLGFAVALLVASLTFRLLGNQVAWRFKVPPTFADAIAFFLVWWLIDLFWPLAAAVITRRLPSHWRVAKVNRMFGVIPGFLNGALVLTVVLTVVTAFPLPTWIKRQTATSPLATPLMTLAGAFDRLVGPVVQPIADARLNLLTVKPGSEDRVELNFTVHDGSLDSESEARMLDLINAERSKRGLHPLVFDARLTTASRAYARAMLEGGYFSHISPDGSTPEARLSRAGILYVVMGENLAFAPDVDIAHQGLMDSPGHRANILGADYRKAGIGVIDAGVYGKMFVQEFTN